MQRSKSLPDAPMPQRPLAAADRQDVQVSPGGNTMYLMDLSESDRTESGRVAFGDQVEALPGYQAVLALRDRDTPQPAFAAIPGSASVARGLGRRTDRKSPMSGRSGVKVALRQGRD